MVELLRADALTLAPTRCILLRRLAQLYRTCFTSLILGWLLAAAATGADHGFTSARLSLFVLVQGRALALYGGFWQPGDRLGGRLLEGVVSIYRVIAAEIGPIVKLLIIF